MHSLSPAALQVCVDTSSRVVLRAIQDVLVQRCWSGSLGRCCRALAACTFASGWRHEQSPWRGVSRNMECAIRQSPNDADIRNFPGVVFGDRLAKCERDGPLRLMHTDASLRPGRQRKTHSAAMRLVQRPDRDRSPPRHGMSTCTRVDHCRRSSIRTPSVIHAPSHFAYRQPSVASRRSYRRRFFDTFRLRAGLHFR